MVKVHERLGRKLTELVLRESVLELFIALSDQLDHLRSAAFIVDFLFVHYKYTLLSRAI